MLQFAAGRQLPPCFLHRLASPLAGPWSCASTGDNSAKQSNPDVVTFSSVVVLDRCNENLLSVIDWSVYWCLLHCKFSGNNIDKTADLDGQM